MLVAKQNTMKFCIKFKRMPYIEKAVALDVVKWMLYNWYSRCTWSNQMDALYTVM